MNKFQTAERVSHTDDSDNFVFKRSELAYLEAAKLISGNVLEIGTGEGYGVYIIAPKAQQFTSIDKYNGQSIRHQFDNVKLLNMTVPPLKNIDDNTFDYVITFQVIEHIKNDKLFISEIHRVLKENGKLIVSTPNIKMSLTRNPWHVREYTPSQLENLLAKKFSSIDKKGVFGNDKIMSYYNENKKSVERITKWDIFNLQYILPRQLLQIPYDILNRRNRKKLLYQNTSMVKSIKTEDYYLDSANDNCFDLFYIATKK